MRRLVLTVAVALVVAGCGASTATHTITATAKQVDQQTQTLQRCGMSESAACQAAWAAAERVQAIDCGAGLSTDSSCVFAQHVRAGYQAAEKTYGRAPTGMTVATNPVACRAMSGGWRCQSRRNRAVWVVYQRP